eukprot:CAMPEP_0115878216 /NCGR_PEP_ID=MMETSP0287-20121206/26654_1 /TAXON_ID=412157 /ORGANISM="Chrysochromulina rotalis, Strain UIO044" /LENGTH=210 /DNA_ID=CAMNT_0003333815 /DNA_START=9 /DNA_END=641 /DNA_ORIENTATION=+
MAARLALCVVNLATVCAWSCGSAGSLAPRRQNGPRIVAAVQPKVEFSRLQAVAGLRKQASRFFVEATGAECAALAKRFELISVGSLVANVSLALVDPRRPRVRAYGRLDAFDVVTRSGLQGDSTKTLQARQVTFETFYAGETEVKGKFDVDDEDDDSYDEDIEDGQIDMGELVAQHLYLYLSDLEITQYREFSSDYSPGDVVFDSDPDLD